MADLRLGSDERMPLVEVLTAIAAAGDPDAPLRVCQAAVDALPFDGASITVMTDADHQEPICATNQAARRIDELQFELGEGPGIEAYASGRSVLVQNLDEPVEGEWPLFARAAGGLLARRMYAIPLEVGRARIGTLCFHGLTLERMGGYDAANALLAADVAAWAVLGVMTRGPAQQANDWLEGSPLRWAEVHRATGIIGCQMQVPVGTALTCLRAHAFAYDRSLSDVAHDVVEGTLRFDEDGR